jgi:CheY-like chemotaxis protein
MNEKNSETTKKSKKEIKWYTYVDSELDNKLTEFMNHYNVKNQAKVIRSCVNNYLDYIKQILQNDIETKEFENEYVNNFIREAINAYEPRNKLFEELKQKLSPLKTSILMSKELIDKRELLFENIENSIKAIIELEKIIKRHFEEPRPSRYVNRFDILYIEDNELDRKTIETYFKSKRADIKSVETSEEGLEILKISTPNVILLDVDLKTSKINGDKLCKMLKSKEFFSNIPIILITATISEKEKVELLTSTGADDIIIKPINKLADLDMILTNLK